MKKNLLFKAFLSVTFVIGLFSCRMGMGESVDLEAPVLTITSPGNMDFVQKTFHVQGEAHDNRKIESIEIEYKYKKNGADVNEKVAANIKEISKTPKEHKVEWSYEFTFDGDYEVEFEVFAYDTLKNGSDDSHQRIMVLIDSQDPNIGTMTITRNGKYTSKLIPLSFFTAPDGKTAKKDKSENKDYFQNENFKLSTNLKDNYGIEKVFMNLYEINPDTGAETSVLDEIEPDSKDNLYAPSFSFTEEKLVAAKPSLASGIHYLKPYVYASDASGNKQEANEYGVFAWYPEYNKPHVSFNAINDGLIEVTQGAPVIATVFDDDDIVSYGYTLVKLDAFEAPGKTIADFDPKTMTTLGENSGLRDTAIEVITEDKKENGTVIEAATDFDGNPITLGRYYLVIKVEDASGRPDGVYFKATEVKIRNEDAPTVFVDEPDENSVPKLDETSGKKFTIKGRVADNEEGVKIAIAWLGPETSSDDTTKKIRTTEIYFEKTYGFTADETYGTGKIWYLGSGTQSGSGNSYKYDWSKEFDFFDDFKNASNKTDNTNKVFMIAAKDPTGNVTTQTFRMSKFTSKPTFEIKYTVASKTETALNPVVVLEPKPVSFTITPKTSNNMPISKFTVIDDNEKDADKKTKHNVTDATPYTFNITDPQSGQIQNYSLTVEDAVGGKTEQSLTLQFNVVGELDSVDCNSNDGNTFTEGNIIKIQVNFKGAQITCSYSGDKTKPEDGNVPYIQLKGTDFKYKNGTAVPEDKRRAYCTTTSGQKTNTLYFEYKVPEDIEAKKLQIDATSGSNLIKGNYTLSGKVESVTNNFFNGKNYNIDSIAPYIKTKIPEDGNVVSITTDSNGKKSVQIKLTFNESVYVGSGTIVMQRTDGWYIPPVLDNDVFVSIWNDATKDGNNSERMILYGSNTNTYATGKDPNGIDTIIARGPYMQFTNGLVMPKKDSDPVEPDISTKYVLAYNYYYKSGSFDKNKPENLAIGATTGTVAKIREVLENHNYHKTEFEVTSVTDESGDPINSNPKKSDGTENPGSNVVILTVTDDDFIGGLVNGVEYFLTLTADSFFDKEYNYYKGNNTKVTENEKDVYYGLAKNDYKFWVGPTATPVIRVNRTATNGVNDKPTGKTSIKIDCVTPGATIKYITTEQKATAPHISGEYADSIKGTIGTMDNYGELTPATNISKSTLTGLTASTSVTMTNGTGEVTNAVGDGNLNTAQKIGIKATASKNGMTASNGYEGAFKTVIHTVEPGKYRMGWDDGAKVNIPKEQGGYYNGNDFRVYGAQVPEASAYTSGWPLTQNGTDNRSDWQVAWKDSDGKGVVDNNGNGISPQNSYYWVSWQILTPFTLQTRANSFQEHANPQCTYGQYIYYYRMQYWGSN